MGIYKKISLVFLEAPKLQYAKFSPILQDDKWKITIESIFDLPSNSPYQGLLDVKLADKSGLIILQETIEPNIRPIEDEGMCTYKSRFLIKAAIL